MDAKDLLRESLEDHNFYDRGVDNSDIDRFAETVLAVTERADGNQSLPFSVLGTTLVFAAKRMEDPRAGNGTREALNRAFALSEEYRAILGPDKETFIDQVHEIVISRVGYLQMPGLESQVVRGLAGSLKDVGKKMGTERIADTNTVDKLVDAMRLHNLYQDDIDCTDVRSFAQTIAACSERSTSDQETAFNKMAYTLQFAAKRMMPAADREPMGTREALELMIARVEEHGPVFGSDAQKIVIQIDKMVAARIGDMPNENAAVVLALAQSVKAAGLELKQQNTYSR